MGTGGSWVSGLHLGEIWRSGGTVVQMGCTRPVRNGMYSGPTFFPRITAHNPKWDALRPICPRGLDEQSLARYRVGILGNDIAHLLPLGGRGTPAIMGQ